MTRSTSLIAAGVGLVAVALVLARSGQAVGSSPYLPGSDAEVLETVPSFATDPRTRELAALRQQLEARPEDLDLALTLARLDIEEGRARGDPRFFGHAEAALAPWWNLEAPPVAVRVMRATLRQSSHDFEGALVDLTEALKLDPRNPQAWLTQSVVLTVLGRYPDARHSCEALTGLASEVVGAVCVASIDSLQGDALGAHQRLSDAYARAGTDDPSLQSWVSSVLGEVSLRSGNRAQAERHFRDALLAAPADPYTLGAYADLLLDQDRAGEVGALLKGQLPHDALLLRLVIAEERTKAVTAREHLTMLRDRVEAARRRGDVVHRREESRFELELEHNPSRALELARANWAVQREPADARIFLEAAVQARAVTAAEPVVAFLARNPTADPALLKPLAALQELGR